MSFITKTLTKYKSQDPQESSLKLGLHSEVIVLLLGLVPWENSYGMWSINNQYSKKHLIIILLQDKVQKTYVNHSLWIQIALLRAFPFVLPHFPNYFYCLSNYHLSVQELKGNNDKYQTEYLFLSLITFCLLPQFEWQYFSLGESYFYFNK